MGRKVRGRKTLRKNKSGKRRGNKKVKRTYRRRKARGGLRGDVSPELMIYRQQAYGLIKGDLKEEQITEEIRNAHNQVEIYNILEKNNYPGPTIIQQ